MNLWMDQGMNESKTYCIDQTKIRLIKNDELMSRSYVTIERRMDK